MPELGIVIVSHSADIAKGLVSLIREVSCPMRVSAMDARGEAPRRTSVDNPCTGLVPAPRDVAVISWNG